MKTNVSIELTDAERDMIANKLDGKVSKRLATRKDIVQACHDYISSLLLDGTSEIAREILREPPAQCQDFDDQLSRIDPEDRVALEGKPDGYIRAWNRVKNRKK